MQTHKAVVTAAVHAPLEIREVPTIEPSDGEVLVRVEWTASTPLDLHQNDGGLLVKHPQILGDGIGGTVVKIGPNSKRLQVGDKVFGFAWREQKEKAHQELATVPDYLLALLPEGFTLQEAVTLPNNFVTVFHAATADFGLELPWPKPQGWTPSNADAPVLIWGGASSVGQFALQILTWYGYTNLNATASPKNHAMLKEMGAKHLFDYRQADVAQDIRKALGDVPYVLDCIGSKSGSMAPIAKFAGRGTKVAVLLPVIVQDSEEDAMPIYSMDVAGEAEWAEGVDARGVRTHFVLENASFKEHLQPTIMPTLLAEGVVKPNNQKIIEGATLLERAQKAMNALRNKEASGERLVWRVSD